MILLRLLVIAGLLAFGLGAQTTVVGGAGGGSGISGLTTGKIPKATSSTAVGNSTCLSESGSAVSFGSCTATIPTTVFIDGYQVNAGYPTSALNQNIFYDLAGGGDSGTALFSILNGRIGLQINADTTAWALYTINSGAYPQGIESDTVVTVVGGGAHSVIALPGLIVNANHLVGFSAESPSFYSPVTSDLSDGVEIQDQNCNVIGRCTTTESVGLHVYDQSNSGFAIKTGLGKVEFGDQVIIPPLAGSGNAFACIDSTGKFYRSATACTP